MRTTLTLDDDVAALLARARKSRRASLKHVVNEALRQGLKAIHQPPPRRKPFRVQPMNLGRCLVESVDDVAEALAIAEGDRYR